MQNGKTESGISILRARVFVVVKRFVAAERNKAPGAGALQDASARHRAQESPPGFGVRQPSGALGDAIHCLRTNQSEPHKMFIVLSAIRPPNPERIPSLSPALRKMSYAGYRLPKQPTLKAVASLAPTIHLSRHPLIPSVPLLPLGTPVSRLRRRPNSLTHKLLPRSHQQIIQCRTRLLARSFRQPARVMRRLQFPAQPLIF